MSHERKYRHGSLCTGIGAMEVAAERIGWECVFTSEIEKFCIGVIEERFPGAARLGNLLGQSFKAYKGCIDVLTAGFPCQPFSQLGAMEGTADKRHIWDGIRAAYQECRPRVIILENVPAIAKMALPKILDDLEKDNYFAHTFIVPAGATGADHLRNRLWVVAYSSEIRFQEIRIQAEGTFRQVQKAIRHEANLRHVTSGITFNRVLGITPSEVVRKANEVPGWSHRIAALGNSMDVETCFAVIEVVHNFLSCIDDNSTAVPVLQSQTAATAGMERSIEVENNYKVHEGKSDCDTGLVVEKNYTGQGKLFQEDAAKEGYTSAYPGNKYGSDAYKKIINNIPPHKAFITGFAGMCAVAQEKKPGQINIAIDINKNTIAKLSDRPFATHFRFKTFDFIKTVIDKQSDFELLQLLAMNTTFLYLDPPYLLNERRSGRKYYTNELSDDDHTKLLSWAKHQRCMIAISHYDCDFYNSCLAGWHKVTYNIRTSFETKVEALYMNYAPPTELHEYTYLGNDRTERQMIKRKISKLTQKLSKLPALERMALVEAIKSIS